MPLSFENFSVLKGLFVEKMLKKRCVLLKTRVSELDISTKCEMLFTEHTGAIHF